MIDAQVLAMLLEVILVNFTEVILMTTTIILIIIMMITMCFILNWKDVSIVQLSPTIACSNNRRINNIRIIGTVWEL